MKRMFVKLLTAAVIITLLSPAQAAYASFIQPEKKQESQSEMSGQILKLVETHAPEQMNRWKEELAEREQLRSRLKDLKSSRGFHKKHEAMKQELEKKIDKGEMTREEAKKLMKDKHKAFVEKHKKWKEDGKNLNAKLTQAVEDNNKEEITKTLDAMLQRLVKANDMLAERIRIIEEK